MSHEELIQTLQYREFVDSKGEFAIIKLPDGKMTVVNRQGEQVLEPGDYYDMKLLGWQHPVLSTSQKGGMLL